MLKKAIKAVKSTESGQALVETLIALPMAIMLMSAMMQYTIVAAGKIIATYSAYCGVRAIITTKQEEMNDEKLYENVCNAVDVAWAPVWRLTWGPMGIPIPPSMADYLSDKLSGLSGIVSNFVEQDDMNSLHLGEDLVIMAYPEGSGGIGGSGIKPGYKQDVNGRWHRGGDYKPEGTKNGQYAAKGEEIMGGKEIGPEDSIGTNNDVQVTVRFRMAMLFPLAKYIFGDSIGKTYVESQSITIGSYSQEIVPEIGWRYYFPFRTVVGTAFGHTPRKGEGKIPDDVDVDEDKVNEIITNNE